MRIHLHLSEGSISNESQKYGEHVPTTLARLSPNGELILIELQGALEMAGMDEANAGAHVIGALTFEQGISVSWTRTIQTTRSDSRRRAQEHPVLTISHHRLEGKVVTLQKPLAVLEKKSREISADRTDDTIMQETMQDAITEAVRGGAKTSKVDVRSRDPTRTDADEDEIDEDEMDAAEGGPERPAKRVRIDEGSSGPQAPAMIVEKSSSPIRKPPARDAFDFSSSPGRPREAEWSSMVASSSPPRSSPIPAPSDQATGAADEEKSATEAGGERRRKTRIQTGPTNTYYEVVTIIRKKIIFSKRPEPLVKLAQALA